MPPSWSGQAVLIRRLANLTVTRDPYYVINSILPELRPAPPDAPTLQHEYSSREDVMSLPRLTEFLAAHKLLLDHELVLEEDMLA